MLHDLLEPSRGAPPRDEAAAQEILRSLLNEIAVRPKSAPPPDAAAVEQPPRAVVHA